MGFCKKRCMLNNQRVLLILTDWMMLQVEESPLWFETSSRAWYDRLTAYLIKHGFERGFVDTTLFIQKDENCFVIAQIYVDDVFFFLFY